MKYDIVLPVINLECDTMLLHFI